ncbi:MAG: hypothetical protein KDA37_02140, partial [Planctomycetales bacterium]|nr:hypothetical protein [Planctomycetales bacterium]
LGAMGACLWFLYDGAVGYPKKAEIWKAFEELDEETRGEEWPKIAEEHGWPELAPNEHDYNKSPEDIFFQFLMAVPAGLASLWFFLLVVLARGSWIEANDAGVTSSWGKGFKWDHVTRLDKKKWRSKGIARVYSEGEGGKKTFVIDDFKFKREPTGQILRALEDRIPREMIVNGPSEAEVEASASVESAADQGAKS